ncbi:hypothetical protein JAAARDRAFT_35938 [Jaapia argillacea MUCL 33604]|uniref:Uncharacterized protein n=1 Tax=Jaapia argillacea MUCL 33604 TaxID=933084 RepID=A0A067PR72_9AGAM|nr:hypothetical protein JAAARDRAFT_35938 [Jaapia argillacea MUCL 33604]
MAFFQPQTTTIEPGFYKIRNVAHGTIGIGDAIKPIVIEEAITSGDSEEDKPKKERYPVIKSEDEAIFHIVGTEKAGYWISVIGTISALLPQICDVIAPDDLVYAETAETSVGAKHERWKIEQSGKGDGSVIIARMKDLKRRWILPEKLPETPERFPVPSYVQVECRERLSTDKKDEDLWKLIAVKTLPVPQEALGTGLYNIKNVRYGNINVGSDRQQARVVSDPTPAIWKVERIDPKGFAYTISLHKEGFILDGRQAVEANGLLYISDSNLIAAKWIIHPLQRGNTFMILYDSLAVGPIHWVLDKQAAGTQVSVAMEDHDAEKNLADEYLTGAQCFWEFTAV